MYVPGHFREDDPAVLHAAMRRHDFALLVTTVDGAPFATHLPFLVDATRGPLGTLVAHMARANPHWRAFADGVASLVVFAGPHAYISPTWYAPGQHVPTWNYVAIHAYGVPVVVDEPARVRAVLEALVETHEGGAAAAWRLADQDEGYVAAMMKGIVAFEMPIDRLEGKYKLSQNRRPEDRAGAVAALRRAGGEDEDAVADLMAALDAPL